MAYQFDLHHMLVRIGLFYDMLNTLPISIPSQSFLVVSG
jgi:hypothetical protein